MGGFRRRRKVCYFTENNIQKIDYKDVDLLKKFISIAVKSYLDESLEQKLFINVN